MTPHSATRPIVLITGASSGIGAAVAQTLAAHGATVIACARRAELLSDLCRTLPHPESHLAIPVDVTDATAVTTTVTQALARYDHIDTLVCCAGVGVTNPVASMAGADLLQAFQVNVLGVLYPIQAVLPTMLARGAGHIIVVTSVVAQHALPYNGGYAATKAALERLCEALRIELRGTGIHVSVVRPGTVATEFFAQRLGTAGEQRRTRTPGMPPARVAASIWSTICRPRRVVYPRWQDWLLGVCADVFPALSDRVLADQIRWEAPANPAEDTKNR